MPRPQILSASHLFVAIATSLVTVCVVLGSAVYVQACLFTDASVSPSNAIRRLDVGKRLSTVVRPPNDAKQSFSYAEFAGVGAVVGLFAIALLCKARRSRNAIASGAELLHPQFEHPELTLISIPQEALPLVVAPTAALVQ